MDAQIRWHATSTQRPTWMTTAVTLAKSLRHIVVKEPIGMRKVKPASSGILQTQTLMDVWE